MTISETTPNASVVALADLEANRATFLAALAGTPDAALRYRATGEDYALGGLLEHVEAVMRHYAHALSAIREALFGPVRVEDVVQDLAAIAAGLDGSQRAEAVRSLLGEHASFVAEVRGFPPEDFGRTAPVTYGAAADPYPTAPADVVNWVSQHYVEHAEHINTLLGQWSDTTREVIERFGDAFNHKDLSATMALVTEDVVFDDTEPAPDGTRVVGKEAVGKCFANFFASSPTANFTTEEMFVYGDRAVVRWRYDWGDGHVRGVDVMKVRDGLVSEKLAYVKG